MLPGKKQKPVKGAKVTIQDVAARAKVSLGTASRVINGAPNVDPGIRRRVESAIEYFGYRPSAAAQSMRSGTTRAVGIMVRDITAPVLAGFVRGAQEVLEQAGYSLFLACTEEKKERELAFLQVAASRQLDGVIMTTTSEEDSDLLRERKRLQLKIPIVLFDREQPATMDAVLIDHEGGARKATELLIRLGHKRVALITGRDSVYPARSRINGYRQAHRQAGLPMDANLLRKESFSEEASFAQACSLLDMARRPTAIVIGGISMLPGVIRAVRERRLKIPRDVSIISGADSDLAALSTPAVSVIRWDYAELGATAARLLLDRMKPGAGAGLSARRVIVGTELLVRDSCARRQVGRPRRLAESAS